MKPYAVQFCNRFMADPDFMSVVVKRYFITPRIITILYRNFFIGVIEAQQNR